MHVMNGDDVDIRCHADLVIFSVVQESTSVLPDSDSPDSWKEQVPRRITCRLLWKYSDDRGLGPVFILYNGQDGEVILTVCLEEVDYVIKEKKWHEICTTDGQHLELHFNSDDQHFPEFFHLLTEVLTKIQAKKERLTESLKKEFVRGATRDTSLQSVSLTAAPENSESVQSLYANLDDIQQVPLTRVTDLPGTQYNRTEQSNHGNLLNSKPELPPRPKQRLLSATPRHPVPTPRLKSKYNTSFSDTGNSYNQLQEDTTDETIMKPGAGVNTAAKSAVTSTPAEQVRLSVGELSSLAESLQIAIQHGDILQAQEAAERLARLRAQLLITLKASAPTLDPNEQDIRVTVHVEDKETSGGRVTLKLKPSMTIRELKKKMLFTYGFPPDVQRWIIGKRLVKDTDTLARCGVKANGDPVFLYLVSAQSVGLQPGTTFVEDEHGYITPVLVPAQTATDVNMSNGYVSMNGGYITLGPPGSHSSRDPVNRPICPQPPPVEPEHPFELRLSSTPQQAAADRTAVATELPIVAEREQASLQGLPVVVAAPVPAPAPEHEEPPEPEPVEQVGWACQVCTYINVPTRPGCQMCSTDRPRDYKVPDNYHMPEEERKRLEREAELEQLARQAEEVREEEERHFRLMSFEELIALDNRDMITNPEPFVCAICFDTISSGEGVILRECLHTFCRECLEGHIRYNEEAQVKCPYQDDEYSCDSMVTEREIKAGPINTCIYQILGLIQLVPKEVFERYLQRSLVTAESRAQNSYHCKTPDCPGWTIYDDNDNFFNCPVCGSYNCLTCKAIHQGMNCQEYQEDLKIRARNDSAARQSQEMLEKMLEKGDALHCPQCDVVIQKKDGCDWIMCTMCKTEICWVTKGHRWGPAGSGDVTGGCMCRVNGQKCHPNCNNCH